MTMKGYGDVALRATELANAKGLSPREAWDAAAWLLFPRSKASREKSCPKGAFLGLCAAGLVDGMPLGDSKDLELDNAKYAIAAANIIRGVKNVMLVQEAGLWKKVLAALGIKGALTYNHQLEVVLKLAEARLLK